MIFKSAERLLRQSHHIANVHCLWSGSIIALYKYVLGSLYKTRNYPAWIPFSFAKLNNLNFLGFKLELSKTGLNLSVSRGVSLCRK